MQIFKRLIGKSENLKGTLTGQRAAITGGSRGIGYAIARELLARGCDVAIFGRNLEQLRISAEQLGNDFAGSRIFYRICDVTDHNAIKSVFAELAEAEGIPQILINCAGAVDSVPFIKTDPSHWARMLEINLLSAVNCTLQVLPAMLEQGSGRIVNIASTASHKGYQYVSAYCAAKHGLLGFTRAVALEVAQKGVTVNAISPGFTETDLLLGSIDKIVKKTHKSEAEIRADFVQRNAIGRFIKPEEVASAAAWLCEKEQGAITGESIIIAGGEHI